MNTILKVQNIHKHFKVERGFFKQETGVLYALHDINLEVDEFSTLGIIGESGSGKTTLAKIILNLIPATSGLITFDPSKIKNFRKDVQIIFQNPYNSLNPKMRIKDIISEPAVIHKLSIRKSLLDKTVKLLKTVGLDDSALNRFPSEFSGGQRQRICIARALACEPKFLILDEPISSLDLTIQAQMLDLFIRLKEELKLTYIFISHNLAVIRHIADSVIVMKEGRIVEYDSIESIFDQPKNAYTQLLLESARRE